MTSLQENPPPGDNTAAELSTQPAPVRGPRPKGHPLMLARRGWRRLTSMRTALVLLFLLALAAVPGSLLPQRPLNPSNVNQYFAEHPDLAPFLDRLSAFDVFASPWFAAIYLLLFVSLIGCLVPRIRLHFKALRTPPPQAPKRFDRLPESDTYTAEADLDATADTVQAQLKGARWRVVRRTDGDQVTLAAEKGYLRETGNLLFHVSLTAVLVLVAIGRVWGYSGTVVVEEGNGFCNTMQQYDAFRPGRLIDNASLAPFCVTVKDFSASYEPDATANQYNVDVTYSEDAGVEDQTANVRVNHPLRLEGLRLYLLGHGFSPIFTVRDPSGQTFSKISAPFIPQDSLFTSEGVVKLPDTLPKQTAIEGLFVPTAGFNDQGLLTSIWPQAQNPQVAIFAYQGSIGLDTGRPQSVYSLDRRQIEIGALKREGSKTLSPGESLTLKDGTRITFDGYKEWASMQVSRDPAQKELLIAAILLVVGLLLSLRVRRRRVWFRLTPTGRSRQDGGGTSVEVGGLARSDAGVFSDEFARLVEKTREDGRS